LQRVVGILGQELGLTPAILATQKAEIRRIIVQSQPKKIVSKTLSFWAGRVAQVVKCLPSKCETLSSNPGAKKKNSIVLKSLGFVSSLIEGDALSYIRHFELCCNNSPVNDTAKEPPLWYSICILTQESYSS
jgi:hypothetical protein